MLHCIAPTPTKVAAARDGGPKLLPIVCMGLVFFLVSAAGAADERGSLAPAAEQALERIPAARVSLSLDSWHPPVNPFVSQTAPELHVPAYGRWDLSAPSWPLAEPAAGMPGPGPGIGTELRPHGPAPFEGFAGEQPASRLNGNLEFDKTVWQRLAEYRSRNRVRVLTLWESTASTVSIQTDRRGGPSLQWTSRWMNRGGATRGLLDHWMPMSMFRFSRTPNSPDSGRPAAPPPALHLGAGTGAIP